MKEIWKSPAPRKFSIHETSWHVLDSLRTKDLPREKEFLKDFIKVVARDEQLLIHCELVRAKEKQSAVAYPENQVFFQCEGVSSWIFSGSPGGPLGHQGLSRSSEFLQSLIEREKSPDWSIELRAGEALFIPANVIYRSFPDGKILSIRDTTLTLKELIPLLGPALFPGYTTNYFRPLEACRIELSEISTEKVCDLYDHALLSKFLKSPAY